MRAWAILLLWGCWCEALSIGSFRLGMGEELSPAQYREYIKSRTPPTPRVNVKSPLWYIYENENTLAHKIQMAELKQAEMELGVKFWKIKVTNSRLRSFWRQMFHAGMPPVPRIGGKMRLGLHRARPETPYFYNMFTGEGLAGIADSTSLKKLALGKPLNRGPYQELAAPGSQEAIDEVADREEKELLAMEDTYSDEYFIKRYRRERDQALKIHRKQYRTRKLLSKLRLAKPLPPPGEEDRRIEFVKADEKKASAHGGMMHALKQKVVEKKKQDKKEKDKKEKKGKKGGR